LNKTLGELPGFCRGDSISGIIIILIFSLFSHFYYKKFFAHAITSLPCWLSICLVLMFSHIIKQ
jgi:hypothetical protein